MWGWFGGQSAQRRRDAPKNAIIGLRDQLDMLQKRERHVEAQIAEADATARKNISTNKNGKHSILHIHHVQLYSLHQALQHSHHDSSMRAE